ncbi:MAG: response regulator [Clostridia bacterium]|nr:response regulator [Clostridia bacterium]
MNKKVLIIDDMPFNIRLLKQILEDEGYVVYSISNVGQGIVSAVCEIMPSVIILDIMMPEISGYDICQQIKKHTMLDSIPVIMLSAMADENSMKLAFEAGACDYISKPFEEEQVLTKVQSALKIQKRESYLEILTDASSKKGIHGPENDPEEYEFKAERVYERVSGDREFFKQTIDTFEESTTGLLAEIKTGIESGDHQVLTQAVHAMKSMIMYFNANKAERILEALSSQIKSGSFHKSEELRDALQQEISEMVLTLRRYLENK